MADQTASHFDSSFNLQRDSYSKGYFERYKHKLPSDIFKAMVEFFNHYSQAVKETDFSFEECVQLFETYFSLIVEQLQSPVQFSPYHQKVCSPFNYYAFGQNFIRPLVDQKLSTIESQQKIEEISKHIRCKDNVILFANHQIEADPQALSLLVERFNPTLAEDMVFVAGHRVTTDPFAIPFSLGRNLICIYSKRHIDHPPEARSDKLLHNQRTLRRLGELLSEGGKCIYVAPSGGRDRPNENGLVLPAPFDPDSIEMFYLLSKHAKCPTHFYPLSLSTYAILPPPRIIQKELGEKRIVKHAPIHAIFGDKLDMEVLGQHDVEDKKLIRQKRAEEIWRIVCTNYSQFPPQREIDT